MKSFSGNASCSRITSESTLPPSSRKKNPVNSRRLPMASFCTAISRPFRPGRVGPQSPPSARPLPVRVVDRRRVDARRRRRSLQALQVGDEVGQLLGGQLRRRHRRAHLDAVGVAQPAAQVRRSCWRACPTASVRRLATCVRSGAVLRSASATPRIGVARARSPASRKTCWPRLGRLARRARRPAHAAPPARRRTPRGGWAMTRNPMLACCSPQNSAHSPP